MHVAEVVKHDFRKGSDGRKERRRSIKTDILYVVAFGAALDMISAAVLSDQCEERKSASHASKDDWSRGRSRALGADMHRVAVRSLQ